MKLTLIGLLIIIIIMLFVQISFRDNFDVIEQKEFRKDLIDYNLKHLTLVKSDGKEIECGELNSDNTNINRKTICEGYQSMAQNKYALAAEKCSIVNDITEWRVRANRIPETADGLKKTQGCGFCYDTKNVYYGDENGPFKDVGPNVCNNWIKPGGDGIGGSAHKKNIFGVYPFEDDLYKIPSNKNWQFGMGVVKDTVKMYEQDLCKQMKNCGDQPHQGEDGAALCGWCAMGRKGDGIGEGMVRKGGMGLDQNETKYDDDFCHWPREINQDGTKNVLLYKKETKELKKWRGNAGKTFKIIIGDLSGTDVSLNNPGRLMNGLTHCAASNNLFPCFSNFSGKVVNENGKIKHSKECYDDIWRNFALYKDGSIDISCNGDIKERIQANLPSSRTFTLWDKTFIPTVESAVQKIPERMAISKQYNANYPDKAGIWKTKNDDGWFLQNMFSALLNSKACKNVVPDPCNDKYRDASYNFFRPKDCIDKIIKESFKDRELTDGEENFYNTILKTDPEYKPGDDTTYKYYWPVKNDPIWREGIHFDWSNEDFKKKLKEKWNDLSKLPECKAKGNVNEMYDKALVAVKYVTGTEQKDMDIIEKLDAKLWEDNDGGTRGLWVKMCWEDFRKELKTMWGNDDTSFINKKGQINITKYPNIKDLITDDSKFYHRVLSYKDESTGSIIPVELTEMGEQTYITKQNYKHKYFPFWRLWKNETKYYIKSEYDKHTREKQDSLKRDNASRSIKNTEWESKYKLSLRK